MQNTKVRKRTRELRNLTNFVAENFSFCTPEQAALPKRRLKLL